MSGTGLFVLADPVWLFRSDSEPGTGLFGLEMFWSEYEILHVNFLMQTNLNQRKVLLKKTTNMICHCFVTSLQHQRQLV